MTCALHLNVGVLRAMTCLLCVRGSWALSTRFPEPALPPAKESCHQAAGSCNDGDRCTNDVCDMITGSCRHDRVADYERCTARVRRTRTESEVIISEDLKDVNPHRRQLLRDRCSIFCGCQENPDFVAAEAALFFAENELAIAKDAVKAAEEKVKTSQERVDAAKKMVDTQTKIVNDANAAVFDAVDHPVDIPAVQKAIVEALVRNLNNELKILKHDQDALKNAEAFLKIDQQKLEKATAKLQSAQDERNLRAADVADTPICIPYCEQGKCPCPPPHYPACVGTDGGP